MSEFELRRALRGLDRERSPTRDLWPGIAARIAADEVPAASAPARAVPPPRRRWAGLAMAAALLLAVLVALPRLPAPTPSADLAGASASTARQAEDGRAAGPPQGARTLQRHADALTLEYVAALDQLGAAPPSPALAPTLSELDSSATQIRAALRQDPGAVYLLEQLRRTYDQRLRLTQLALSGPHAHTG